MMAAALLDWAESHQIRKELVSIYEFNSFNRGLVTTGDVQAGTIVLSVPRPLALSDVGAASSPELAQVLDDLSPLSAMHLLALQLLIECNKGEASLWWPWLQMLPGAEQLDGVLFWGDRDWDLARGCTRIKSLHEEVETCLLKAYSKVLSPLFSCVPPRLLEFDLEKWRWANGICLSRAFELQVHQDKHLLLVPLIDMLNHSQVLAERKGSCVRFDTDADQFVVCAAHELSPGEEVMGSYGRKPNAELLAHYGFALSGNRFDTVEVSLALPMNPPDLMMLRMAALPSTMFRGAGLTLFLRWKDCDASGESSKPEAAWELDISSDSLFVLRVCAAQSASQIQMLQMHAMAGNASSSLQDPDLEKASMILLREVCRARLADYSELSCVDGDTPNWRQMCILETRRGELTLLNAAIAWSEAQGH